jgi:serine/threonine protein kinase
MSTVSVPSLVGQIRELPLLDAAALAQLPGLAAACADAGRLLQELERRQWLTPFQSRTLLAGQGRGLVLGAYLLLDVLGQGSMGRVYRARHLRDNRRIAIKVIPPELLHSRRLAKRFQREIYVATQLHHPNIVIAYDAGQVGHAYYLAMEYIDGIDLSRLVKQNGPMPFPMACDLISQAALALQYAHDKDLVHRDLKPSNLMVVRHPNHPPAIKVLDFGLARLLTEVDGEGRLTQVGGVVGTVDYISPEQATNARQADARSDIFSLGATLFYILTGMPPYAGKDVVERVSARVLGDARRLCTCRPGLPAGLDGVVAKMMTRDPALRYSTAADVTRALEPFCLVNVAPVTAPLALLVPDPPTAIAASESPLTIADARRGTPAAPLATVVPPFAFAPSGQPVVPPSHSFWKTMIAAGVSFLLVVALGSLLLWSLWPASPKGSPRPDKPIKR